MIRPLAYKTITKLCIASAILLLWNRFVESVVSMGDLLFIVAVFFLLLCWFRYLRMDGFSIHHLLEEKEKKTKKVHVQRDIVDFVDEKIVSFQELEEDERDVVVLLSYGICALMFGIISLLWMVL